MRYHLAEWGRANTRCVHFYIKICAIINGIFNSPANKEELFNLRHASARNVIERIFGVLKRRFRILLMAPEYNAEIQARIPAALCTIHNVIREFDESEGKLPPDNNSFGYGYGGDEPRGSGSDESDIRRDRIAEEMWRDYQRVLEERGLLDETEEEFLDSDEWDEEEEI